MSDQEERIRMLLEDVVRDAQLDPELRVRTLRKARRRRAATVGGGAVVASVALAVLVTATRYLQAPTEPASDGSASPTESSSPVVCSGADMVVEVASQEGAAGTIRTVWRVTNGSSTTCRTQGYPELTFRGPSGVFEVPASQGGYGDIEGPAEPVSIGAGKAASFVIYWSDVTTAGGDCRSFDTVLVGLPGTQGRTEVAATGCVSDAPMHLGPLTPADRS